MLRLARLAVALLVVLASAAPSQGELNGEWFKIKVKAKGFTIGPEGEIGKASYVTTVYMHLTADGSLYDYSITYEAAEDVWETTLLNNFNPTGEDSNVVVDESLTLPGAIADLDIQTTFRFTFKKDKLGALLKATLKSDSGHIVSGNLQGLDFWGSVTLTGVTVTTDKLPFNS